MTGRRTRRGGRPYSGPAVAAAAAPPFSPTSLPSMFQWIDANVGVTQSSGAVSQWDDQSGNTRHFTQATGTKQPTYSATGFDGAKPAVTFDGTTDILLYNGSGIYAAGTGTLYFVLKPVALSLSSGLWQECSTSSVNPFYNMKVHNGTASTLAFPIRADNNTVMVTTSANIATSALVAGTAVLIVIIDNGTSITARINGTAQSPTAFTRNTLTLTQTVLGATNGNNVNGAWSNTAYAEMATYTAQHVQANIEKMEGYLAWRWGLQALLPGGHPYKSAPP